MFPIKVVFACIVLLCISWSTSVSGTEIHSIQNHTCTPEWKEYGILEEELSRLQMKQAEQEYYNVFTYLYKGTHFVVVHTEMIINTVEQIFTKELQQSDVVLHSSTVRGMVICWLLCLFFVTCLLPMICVFSKTSKILFDE